MRFVHYTRHYRIYRSNGWGARLGKMTSTLIPSIVLMTLLECN